MTMHSDYQTHDATQDEWPKALVTMAMWAAVAVIAMWYTGL
jgi:hypothetical protein